LMGMKIPLKQLVLMLLACLWSILTHIHCHDSCLKVLFCKLTENGHSEVHIQGYVSSWLRYEKKTSDWDYNRRVHSLTFWWISVEEGSKEYR
jgi:hypothetical protein